MRILVTGGIGRIGRVTVKQLATHGHEVVTVDRLPENELDEEMLVDIEGAQYRQLRVSVPWSDRYRWPQWGTSKAKVRLC